MPLLDHLIAGDADPLFQLPRRRQARRSDGRRRPRLTRRPAETIMCGLGQIPGAMAMTQGTETLNAPARPTLVMAMDQGYDVGHEDAWQIAESS